MNEKEKQIRNVRGSKIAQYGNHYTRVLLFMYYANECKHNTEQTKNHPIS